MLKSPKMNNNKSDILCTLCLENKSVSQIDVPRCLYYCKACDHTFTLKDEDHLERYDESYFIEKHPNWFANPNQAFFNWVNATIKKYQKKDKLKLVDLGCGNGDLLKHLSKANSSLELYGIDAAPNSHPGVTFTRGDFFKDSIHGQFDVVCSLMVIEHVDKPRRFAEIMNEYLVPGGFLILSTNNNHCLLYVLARFFKIFGFRTAFDRIYSDHHLQHFSNKSLRSILEKNGFEILSLWNHNYPLNAVDMPAANFLIKKFYLAVVAVIFFLSTIFGNGFLQTYVCRKKTT